MTCRVYVCCLLSGSQWWGKRCFKFRTGNTWTQFRTQLQNLLLVFPLTSDSHRSSQLCCLSLLCLGKLPLFLLLSAVAIRLPTAQSGTWLRWSRGQSLNHQLLFLFHFTHIHVINFTYVAIFFKLAIIPVNTGWHCCCSGTAIWSSTLFPTPNPQTEDVLHYSKT